MLIHSASMAMLIAFFFATMALMYRYGPPPVGPRQRIKPGALRGAVLNA
jgi:hypothetical protein